MDPLDDERALSAAQLLRPERSSATSEPPPQRMSSFLGRLSIAWLLTCLGCAASGFMLAPWEVAVLWGALFAAPLGLLFAIGGALLNVHPLLTAGLQTLAAVALVGLALLLFDNVGAAILALWLGQLIGGSAQLVVFARLRRRPPEGHCHACGYNLTGLPERRCPECGRPF